MSAEAVRAGMQAAVDARRVGRWSDAARWLDRVASAAAALPEGDPQRLRWTVATAECAQMLGGSARARTLAGEALRAPWERDGG